MVIYSINKSDLCNSPAGEWGWLCCTLSSHENKIRSLLQYRGNQCVDLWPFIWTYKLRGQESVLHWLFKCCCSWSDAADEEVSCETISESQNCKAANPCIGQAYRGDSGSKSGLKRWSDGMESAAERVECVFSVWICWAEVLEQASVLFFKYSSECVCLRVQTMIWFDLS